MVTEDILYRRIGRFLKSIRLALGRRVSTVEVVEWLEHHKPRTWHRMLIRYGVGGRGNGYRHTAHSVLATWLEELGCTITGRVPAPDWWGNPWVTVWRI